MSKSISASPIVKAEHELKTVSVQVSDRRDADAYLQGKEINVSTATNSLVLNTLSKLFRIDYVGVNRTLILMEEDNPICATTKLKTPQRQKKYIFSKAINLFLGRLLYQHQDDKPLPQSLLDEEGKITRLADVFSMFPNKYLVLGRAAVYGPEIDKQIAELLPQNILYREGADFDQIPIIFDRRRNDFLLGYPAQVFELLGKNFPIRSYKLAATAEYVVSHLMCTDTPETQALLQQVDNNLDTLYKNGQLLQAHLRWLPNSEQETFKQLFHSVFVQSAQH
ncbi:hypothetical protein [Paraglaciecola sp.]|uniref:hypothetical protein n=1 Tax=Paraglaciecola sp. TaxID=1920173 RepID=UPI0030F477E6